MKCINLKKMIQIIDITDEVWQLFVCVIEVLYI